MCAKARCRGCGGNSRPPARADRLQREPRLRLRHAAAPVCQLGAGAHGDERGKDVGRLSLVLPASVRSQETFAGEGQTMTTSPHLIKCSSLLTISKVVLLVPEI